MEKRPGGRPFNSPTSTTPHLAWSNPSIPNSLPWGKSRAHVCGKVQCRRVSLAQILWRPLPCERCVHSRYLPHKRPFLDPGWRISLCIALAESQALCVYLTTPTPQHPRAAGLEPLPHTPVSRSTKDAHTTPHTHTALASNTHPNPDVSTIMDNIRRTSGLQVWGLEAAFSASIQEDPGLRPQPAPDLQQPTLRKSQDTLNLTERGLRASGRRGGQSGVPG